MDCFKDQKTNIELFVYLPLRTVLVSLHSYYILLHITSVFVLYERQYRVAIYER